MKSLAVINARLIDGAGTSPVKDAVIVIEDGVFKQVGAAPDTMPPVDATVIDAGGRTVMPGLIDGHMHLNHGPFKPIRALTDTLRMGVTTVATVQGMPASMVSALRDAIESGTLETCSRLIAGEVVAPTNGHVKGRVADGPWEARKAVREVIQAGVDFIKTAASGGFYRRDERMESEDYTFEELSALTEEAHAKGKPVAVHAHTQPGLNNSIRCGIDIIYHGAMIDRKALDGIAEKGLFYIPTLRVTSQTNIDYKYKIGRDWEGERMKRAQPIHREGVRKAREMGIKIGVGTDFGVPLEGALPPDYPWRVGDTAVELVELVACGFTPMEAIVAGTRTTAEAFGMADRIGTIETGRKADLIVVDGDPLEDIAVLCDESKISLVVKDGAPRVCRWPESTSQVGGINLGNRM